MINYYRTYIGIDPGAKGAIGVLSYRGNKGLPAFFSIEPYSHEALIRWVRAALKWNKPGIALERVYGRPGQNSVATFNFGKSYGEILGILHVLGVEPTLVMPRKWKEHFGIIQKKGATKNEVKKAAIEKAKEMFGRDSLLRTPRSRVPDDGMAEAILIATWLKDVTEMPGDEETLKDSPG